MGRWIDAQKLKKLPDTTPLLLLKSSTHCASYTSFEESFHNKKGENIVRRGATSIKYF